MSDTPPPNPPSSPTPSDPTPPTPPAAPIPNAGTSSAPTTVPYASGATEQVPDAADVEKNKVFALLSYIFILWLVPLLAAKDSPFAKYHANQGIMLTIVGFVGGVGLWIVFFIVAHIPILGFCGGCAGCVVQVLFSLAILALAIVGILNAVNGKMKPLPLFPAITLIK